MVGIREHPRVLVTRPDDQSFNSLEILPLKRLTSFRKEGKSGRGTSLKANYKHINPHSGKEYSIKGSWSERTEAQRGMVTLQRTASPHSLSASVLLHLVTSFCLSLILTLGTCSLCLQHSKKTKPVKKKSCPRAVFRDQPFSGNTQTSVLRETMS